MALNFTESFAGFSSASDFTSRGYTVANSPFVFLDTTGPFGNNCIKITSDSTGGLPRVHRNLSKAMSGTTGRIAFWMKTSAGFTPSGITSSSGYLVALENATPNSWVDIAVGDSGHIYVSRSESARSSTKDFSLCSRTKVNDGTWHHIQVELTLSTTTGSGKLWVDGELQHTVSNIDTVDAATAFSTYTRVAISACRLSNTDQDVFVSDLIVWDDSGTDFTGALPSPTHRVFGVLPDAAGSSSAFTPSAGSNFQNVDEVSSDGDTTYNSTNTSGNIDLFSVSDISSGYGILGVAVSINARSEAGTPSLNAVTRISGSNYTGTASPVTTSYANYEFIFEDSPATGNDWTLSEINGAEFGYSHSSGTDTIRATRVLVEAVCSPPTNNEVRVSSFFTEIIIEEGFLSGGGVGTISTTVIM